MLLLQSFVNVSLFWCFVLACWPIVFIGFPMKPAPRPIGRFVLFGQRFELFRSHCFKVILAPIPGLAPYAQPNTKFKSNPEPYLKQ